MRETAAGLPNMASTATPIRKAGAIVEPDLDDVARIAPVIAAWADDGERTRRLPPALLDALHGAALFRLLLPRRFGGAEMPLHRYMPIIEAVARHDGSTAWCLGQANGCAMTAGFLEPDVAQAIWGDDPRAVLAWGPGKGSAVPERGGFRVTGRWSFASGMRHATWLGGMSAVPNGEDPAPIRTMLFPADQAETTEIWDVLGLLGTGSDAFAVNDLYVRDDHVYDRDEPSQRREPGPLYLFPLNSPYATGFSATALGLAQSMLDEFIGLAQKKTPRLAMKRLADEGVVQFEVGECRARLGAARAFLLDELESVWEEAAATDCLTLDHRMRIRLATTFAIREAKEVCDTVFDAAGATAIFASNGMQRRFRDLHTVAQQVQGRKGHLQTVGAHVLGLSPDLAAV